MSGGRSPEPALGRDRRNVAAEHRAGCHRKRSDFNPVELGRIAREHLHLLSLGEV